MTSVFLLSSSGLKYNRVKSCGCLGKKQNARCPGCGRYFPITLDGTPTPQFCPDCAPKYAGRNWRVCPVCHKLFPSPPSSNAITCSAACSSVWKSLTHKGLRVNWSDESRQRLSAKGKTENLKLGTAAAQRSPIAGRFETNQNAKIWTLVDPCGNKITVRNLILWARENTGGRSLSPPDCFRLPGNRTHYVRKAKNPRHELLRLDAQVPS